MLSYNITLAIPNKGIVTEKANGYELSAIVDTLRSKYAFRGVVLSAVLLNPEQELAKLNIVSTDENIQTEKEQQ